MFRFVTLSTSPSASQSRMKSVRSDMKTNVKQNTRWILNDSILTKGTGLLPVAFFRINVKQSMTLYAEMCRYFVKIFCKLKLTVSVCRTRSAKRSRRPNVIRNWLWNIYFLVVFLLIFSCLQVYEDKCSVTYETEYEEVCTTQQEQKCEAWITWKLKLKRAVMTLTLPDINDFIVSISNPWSQTKYDVVTETKCETQYETVYDEQCAPGIVLTSEISSSWHWHFSDQDCLRQQVRKSLRDSLRGIKMD